MNKVPFWAFYCALWLVGWGLCACQPRGTPQPIPLEAKTHIIFAYPAYLTAFTQANYQVLADEFNQSNPDMWVELREVTSDDLMTSGLSYLDLIAEKKIEVDVAMSRAFSSLITSNWILPLDNLEVYYPGMDISDFYPLALEMLTHENSLRGIPFELDLLVMYYNKDLFDKAGVPYPTPNWSRDDFLGIAEALRRSLPEGKIAFGGQIDEVVPFIYTHGGQLRDDEGYTLTDPLAIEAVKWFTDLSLIHQVMPLPTAYEAYQPEEKEGSVISSETVSDGEVPAYRLRWGQIAAIAFMAAQEGDVALWANGMTTRGGTGGWDWDFDWGILPWPRDRKEVVISYPYAYFITKSTQEPEAALRWIDFLTRQNPLMKGLPARRSVAGKAAQTFEPQVDETGYQALLSLLETASPLWYGEYYVSELILGEAMLDILENQVVVEQALTKAQTDLDSQR